MYIPTTMSRVCVCMIYRMFVVYVHTYYNVRCMCLYPLYKNIEVSSTADKQ